MELSPNAGMRISFISDAVFSREKNNVSSFRTATRKTTRHTSNAQKYQQLTCNAENSASCTPSPNSTDSES